MTNKNFLNTLLNHFVLIRMLRNCFMMSIYENTRNFVSATFGEINETAKERVNRVVNFLFERMHSTRVLSKENKILDTPRVAFYKLMRKEGYLDREFVSLPIPPLTNTLNRFLDSMLPIMKEADFEELKRLKTEFEENEGVELQRNLLCYATWQKNWLTPLWEQYAYLIDRKSLAFGTNYYGLGPVVEPQIAPHLAQKVELRLLRASMAIQTGIEMIHLSNQQKFKDPFAQGPVSLEMDQYLKLFGTTRIPQTHKDRLSTSKSPHFILFLQNSFIKIEFESGKVPPLNWIVNTLISVEKTHKPITHGTEVLTSLDRDTWAEYRKKLIELGNERALEDIESAQFSIILDPRAPQDYEEIAQLSQLDFYGKWFDLGVQLIIYKNGKLSGNLEHTSKDAIVTASLIEMISINESKNREANGGVVSYNEGMGELKFQIIRFQLDPHVVAKISEAKSIFRQTASRYDLSLKFFKKFGKEKIKLKNLSPDSFIQMALQLTYYKIHEKHVLTYETATLRGFSKGRTETIRSQSALSKSFCEAMLNSQESIHRKKELLCRAVNYHNETKINAMKGEGIDRHLMGLRLTAIASKISSPFLESSAVKLGFQMATSQTPIPGCFGGGFLPLEEGGYGISYNAAFLDEIVFMISGFKEGEIRKAEEFSSVLFGSLDEMMEVL